MLRTECELNEKVPPSPPETLVQGLGPLDSPLSIGFEAQYFEEIRRVLIGYKESLKR